MTASGKARIALQYECKQWAKQALQIERFDVVRTQRRHVIFGFDPTFFRRNVIKGQGRDTNTDNHLRNLSYRNDHSIHPLWFQLDSHEKVIAIHDTMDGIIHGGKVNARGRLCDIGMPAIQENGNVMVPMKKNDCIHR
jgi:hypothetical protein